VPPLPRRRMSQEAGRPRYRPISRIFWKRTTGLEPATLGLGSRIDPFEPFRSDCVGFGRSRFAWRFETSRRDRARSRSTDACNRFLSRTLAARGGTSIRALISYRFSWMGPTCGRRQRKRRMDQPDRRRPVRLRRPRGLGRRRDLPANRDRRVRSIRRTLLGAERRGRSARANALPAAKRTWGRARVARPLPGTL
jgi:hypothetical protein